MLAALARERTLELRVRAPGDAVAPAGEGIQRAGERRAGPDRPTRHSGDASSHLQPARRRLHQVSNRERARPRGGYDRHACDAGLDCSSAVAANDQIHPASAKLLGEPHQLPFAAKARACGARMREKDGKRRLCPPDFAERVVQPQLAGAEPEAAGPLGGLTGLGLGPHVAEHRDPEAGGVDHPVRYGPRRTVPRSAVEDIGREPGIRRLGDPAPERVRRVVEVALGQDGRREPHPVEHRQGRPAAARTAAV
jgi:hypothetical protein